MDAIVMIALGFGGIAAAVVFLLYIRSEKSKLKRSVLEYEKIRKKLDESGE